MNIQKGYRTIFSALLMTIGLAACTSQPPTFKIAVIVDTATDPVSREEVEAVVEIVTPRFKELTGFRLETIEIVEDARGGSIERIATDYMEQAPEIPNGILIFSVGDDDRAKINRAYAQQVPGPQGFHNSFVSPYPHLGDSHVYIAVLQFNHLYAACGYAGMDTIQSPFSSGDECRGVEGEICAEWEGLQVCPVALPFLEGRTRTDMAAEPIVHEFAHPFGLGGPDAHYGTEACNLAMGWEPDHNDEAEGIFYNGMCPNVWDAFANSYHP
jgi:hypothetical protein